MHSSRGRRPIRDGMTRDERLSHVVAWHFSPASSSSSSCILCLYILCHGRTPYGALVFPPRMHTFMGTARASALALHNCVNCCHSCEQIIKKKNGRRLIGNGRSGREEHLSIGANINFLLKSQVSPALQWDHSQIMIVLYIYDHEHQLISMLWLMHC